MTKVSYKESIIKGLRAVNKNYAILFIQTGVLFAAFFLFLLIVGTPAIIIFTKAGFELPEEGLKELLKMFLRQGLQTYISLIITLVITFLIYLSIVSVIFIYAIAGTSGVLMSYISGKEGYSWSLFHSYGKRFFKKFFMLSLSGLFVLLLLSFIAGILSGLTKASIFTSQEFLKEFFTNFLNLLSILISLTMVILFMATFTYAAGFLLLKESTGISGALKDAFNFIIKKPESLGFYALLSFGAILLTLIFGVFGTIFKGPGGFILYQLLLSLLQIYINLAVISCAFVYLKESL